MWVCPKCETINQNGDMSCYVCSCTYAEFEQYRLNRIAIEEKKKKEAEAAIKIDPDKMIKSLKKTSAAKEETPEERSIDVELIESEREKGMEKRRKKKLKNVLNVILVIVIITYVAFMIYELGVNACYNETAYPEEISCIEITEQELVIQCQNGMICMDIF